MPTNRPKIVIYSNDDTIKKLDELAKANNRSRGNMAEVIIEEYIKGNYTNNTVNIEKSSDFNINM